MIAYNDPFVMGLDNDIHAFIETTESVSDDQKALDIKQRLEALGQANCPALARYWQQTEYGAAVVDRAFKGTELLYYFPEQLPEKIFYTSGTSSAVAGRCAYSARGMRLMKASVLHAGKTHIVRDLERPAIIRLLPSTQTAPNNIMAYGMECIAKAFGDPSLSQAVINNDGFDQAHLLILLKRACSEQRPVILIGGSFAFVNIIDRLKQAAIRFELPTGSRLIDAGGFKGRSRDVSVADLHHAANEVFGIAPENCTNIFGMTELASQLYDTSMQSVGPLGERPKANTRTVTAIVSDSHTLKPVSQGQGLLTIRDLCIIDRPFSILTGDLAIQNAAGMTVIGRAQRGDARGCSLSLEVMPSTPDHSLTQRGL